MSIVVVGGTAKAVGKTALICGMIAALPEREWTAIKITSHVYRGVLLAEKIAHDSTTDTGRYLLAGAKKALLAEAGDDAALTALASDLLREGGNIVIESNRIVSFLAADLCLGVFAESAAPEKPSFATLLAAADGLVARTGVEWPVQFQRSGVSLFAMDDFGRVSPRFAEWVLARLSLRGQPETPLS